MSTSLENKYLIFIVSLIKFAKLTQAMIIQTWSFPKMVHLRNKMFQHSTVHLNQICAVAVFFSVTLTTLVEICNHPILAIYFLVKLIFSPFLVTNLVLSAGGMFNLNYFDNSKVSYFDSQKVLLLKKNIFSYSQTYHLLYIILGRD